MIEYFLISISEFWIIISDNVIHLSYFLLAIPIFLLLWWYWKILLCNAYRCFCCWHCYILKI